MRVQKLAKFAAMAACVLALSFGSAMAHDNDDDDDDDDNGFGNATEVKCNEGKSLQEEIDKAKIGDILLQIGSVEPLGEPGVDRGEEVAGLGGLAL